MAGQAHLLKKGFRIKFNDFIRAGEVSIGIQNILKNIGFEKGFIKRVAICAYEAEMNMVMHGSDGTASLIIGDDKIILEFRDHGPGIDDLEWAMQPGTSTANIEHQKMGFGAGMGFPNMKNHSDHLHVETEKGKGTYVRMEFDIKGLIV